MNAQALLCVPLVFFAACASPSHPVQSEIAQGIGGGVESIHLPPELLAELRAFEKAGIRFPFRLSNPTRAKGEPLGNHKLPQAIWESELASRPRGGRVNEGVLQRVDGLGRVTFHEKRKTARVGDKTPAGSSVSAENGPNLQSNVDVFLGDSGGAIRVTGGSQIEILRLHIQPTEIGKIATTMIDLREGRVFGDVKKLAPQSKYLIRTRGGVIRIFESAFEVHADGACAIQSGSAQVITPTHIYTVNAGEMYSPSTTASILR